MNYEHIINFNPKFIPTDALTDILKKISIEEIPSKRLINKSWYQLLTIEEFWKKIFLINLGSEYKHLLPQFSFRSYVFQFANKLKHAKNECKLTMALEHDHINLAIMLSHEYKIGMFSLMVRAASCGSLLILQYLIESGILVELDDELCIHFLNGLITVAAGYGRDKTMEFIIRYLSGNGKLIEEGSNNYPYLNSALCYACDGEYDRNIFFSISKNDHVKYNYNLICKTDHLSCVKILLKYGAYPHHMCYNGRYQPDIFIFGKKLDDGSDDLFDSHFSSKRVAFYNFNSLRIACNKDNIECVKYLLEANVDPNKTVNNTTTPLSVAVFNYSNECVNYFLEYFTDINNDEYIKILIDKTIRMYAIPSVLIMINPQILNKCLRSACQKGFINIITLILSYDKFKSNSYNININELIRISLNHNHYDIVKYLINRHLIGNIVFKK